jgi:hypothetical protein
MNNNRRLAISTMAALAVSVFLGAGAGNAFGYAHINSFSVSPSITQAGGHPDVDITQSFDNRVVNEAEQPESSNAPCGCQDVFEIKNEFPTGFIGNTTAVPRCTLLEFAQRNCPADSQVGIAGAIIFNGQQPIFNLEPHPGEPGLLGFFAPLINAPVFIELAGRTDSDYGLNGRTTAIYHPLPLSKVELHLWGVPGDPSHDIHRFKPPQDRTCFQSYPEPCEGVPPTPFNGSVQPFLENPTSCGSALNMGLELVYYEFTVLRAQTAWPTTTGCDQLSFNPSLTAKPTTTEADTATGLDVDLVVPQSQSATTPSPSEIRASKVTLPPGFSINPNAADGKGACTDQQAAFGTLNEATCPEHSKVGTATIDSSALPGPINGAIYLGQPKPGDPYRIIVTADGFSTHVKLAGDVHADAATGQLVTTFSDLPQSPLQEFILHFFGSERGLLATPDKCGKYPVESEFTPWDAVLPSQTSIAYFTVDSGPNGGPCPGTTRPFAPAVSAGSPDNTAGVHSPFAFRIDRADGDQNLSGIHVMTPPGFSAKLAGVDYCPESAIARLEEPAYSGRVEQSSPACPASSQIGTATVGVGAGTHPFYVPGKVYLAGPYKGAQLSLVTSIPAISGPYDLGNVAVRAAIHVDPLTAQVTTDSDTLPSIVGGVPVRLRSVLINLDRPDFTLNPTRCDPFLVNSRLIGDEGGLADSNIHFQVANCAVLPYAPKLKLRLGGGTNRRGHPDIHATFETKPGEANTSRVSVTLPEGELLDNSHLGAVCPRVDFAAGRCPANSRIGSARVETPLLGQPLSGAVYLRSSSHRLPDMVLDLKGQIDLEAVARISSVNKGLRATFETVPDVPIGTFTLDLEGGKKGLIQNSESLCGVQKNATVRMAGQNGARDTAKVPLSASCGSQASRHRRHRTGEGR